MTVDEVRLLLWQGRCYAGRAVDCTCGADACKVRLDDGSRRWAYDIADVRVEGGLHMHMHVLSLRYLLRLASSEEGISCCYVFLT